MDGRATAPQARGHDPVLGKGEWRRLPTALISFLPLTPTLIVVVVEVVGLAVARELRGHRGWEKSDHIGTHRTLPADPAPIPLSWAETTDRSA